MCGLFGMFDHQNVLSSRQRIKAVNILARASQIRGSDATGIAYLDHGTLAVYKRGMAANRITFKLPKESNIVLGHTRAATQGSSRINRNNHPFWGHADGVKFAVTHKGVITNDHELREENHLPVTAIQTDSYVVAQLLEKEGAISLQSLKKVAEQLQGSFTLVAMDDRGNLFFAKGNSPLTLVRFATGLYLYTSTAEIMSQAICQLGLQNAACEKINLESGEMLMIDCYGQIVREIFDDSRLYQFRMLCDDSYWRLLNHYQKKNTVKEDAEDDYSAALRYFANSVGVNSSVVDRLIDLGFDYSEIEELLYSPADLEYFMDEIMGDQARESEWLGVWC